MLGFSDYLAARRKWTSEGSKGIYAKVSVGVGIALAVTIWFYPEWFKQYVPERMSRLVSVLVPFVAVASVFVFRWIVSSYFVYRNLSQQIAGKPRREILTRILEDVKEASYPAHMGGGTSRYYEDLIVRFIRASEEFGSEADVESVCRDIDASGRADPFDYFELIYGKGAFTGKRLKFLKDARVASFLIRDDTDAVNYLKAIWAEKNGLEEISISDALSTEKGVQIFVRQSLARLKRRFLSGD